MNNSFILSSFLFQYFLVVLSNIIYNISIRIILFKEKKTKRTTNYYYYLKFAQN